MVLETNWLNIPWTYAKIQIKMTFFNFMIAQHIRYVISIKFHDSVHVILMGLKGIQEDSNPYNFLMIFQLECSHLLHPRIILGFSLTQLRCPYNFAVLEMTRDTIFMYFLLFHLKNRFC